MRLVEKFKNISALMALTLPMLAIAEPAVSDYKTGTVIGKHIFGLSRDFQDDPLMLAEDPLIYEKESAFHDLTVGENRFRISLFDNDIAGVYVGEYSKDSNQLIDTSALPMGAMGGVHSIAASMKSAWNTVLFTENSIVDAKGDSEHVKGMKAYFKNKSEMVNPYHYGWLNEVITLDEKGASKAIKNFASGRLFADSIVALPDGKTFYFHDQDFSGNLYLFVADEANSFAKGALYVVGSDLNLTELGKSSALKMKFKLKRVEFQDFFKTADSVKSTCKSGFKKVNSAYGEECLKPVKKNRKYVGQFEPVRQAAILGVSPFSKEKGELKYDGNNNVIKLEQNGSALRQFSLKADEKLGTQYLISNEV